MAPRLEFSFTFARPSGQTEPSRDDDSPFKILVLGNFSGGGESSGRLPLPQRPFIRTDVDQFDKAMSKLSPRLTLGEGPSAQVLEFRTLDDFRPEQLSQQLKAFRQLHELRKKLLNPATFAQAAAELKQSLTVQEPGSSEPVAPPHNPSPENDADLLEQLLGTRPAGLSAPTGPQSGALPGIEQFINKMMEPYIVPKADPNQGVYLAAVDSALGDLLRAVLHLSSFQSLEATWRCLQELVSNIDDDSAVQIFLLDVTQQELLADLPADGQQLGGWSLYRRLSSDSNQTSVPWSLLVGDFRFGASSEELPLLGALAVTAEHLQIPLISAANSNLLGCSSFAETPDPAEWKSLEADVAKYWTALRQSSAAKWVALVLPRVLLRLPYGKETDEVETFAFEEFANGRAHENYLWGNPAYFCAGLIAQAFAEEGWGLQLGSQYDIGSLPAHTYSEDDEVKLQPCGEITFSQRVADLMLEKGFMPLISWKDRDAVRLLRFQSIAEPLAPLSGPWE